MRRIAIVALSAALVITASLGGTARAASVWHVQAGSVGFLPSGAPNFAGGIGNAFYPGTIAVHPGDTVSFTAVGPHVIAFNPPPAPLFTFFAPNGVTTLETPTTFINSGFVGFGPPAPFNVTIGTALPPGSYPYFCMLHFGMKGTIDVVPLSEALPKTDLQYAAIAQRQIARDLAKAAEIAADAREDEQDEDGTPTILVGAGNARVSNLRFFPETTSIQVGQSINFVKKDPTEPHTVTFGPEPADDLLPSGPPPYTYGGTGTVHSGFLLTKDQFNFYHFPPFVPLVQTTRISIKFTAPGTFRYICTIHDGEGMVGTVVVRP